MKRNVIAVVLAVVVAVVFAGCLVPQGKEANSPLKNLRRRAAFEYDCPASQIRITNLDDENKQYGVSACGKKAVFIWHCRGQNGFRGDDCKWVEN